MYTTLSVKRILSFDIVGKMNKPMSHTTIFQDTIFPQKHASGKYGYFSSP